jgi:uncharacterized protein YecA (UPF0149 family)
MSACCQDYPFCSHNPEYIRTIAEAAANQPKSDDSVVIARIDLTGALTPPPKLIIPRNRPCPFCDSGKKYKHCHGK